jgi:ketosteroid isomerase-like protein
MRFLLPLLLLAAIAVNASAQSAADKAIADEIIATVKTSWAAEIKDPSNVTEMIKYFADDYTEFNPDCATRLDGKAIVQRLDEAGSVSPTRGLVGEMLNSKVQVYNGDVAILTYNYFGLGKDKDGKVEPNRAKSTRVFVKKDGKWQLVHANFAADPMPK